VNNYYEPGPASEIFVALNAQIENFPGTQSYYFAGNVMPGHFDETNQDAGRKASYENRTGADWSIFVNSLRIVFEAASVCLVVDQALEAGAAGDLN
jgi:hypothetical protein